MEVVSEKKQCSGCSACFHICPTNAIEMVKDEEGFKYPVVDQSKCLNCGLCKKVCAFSKIDNQEYEQRYYLMRTLDDESRKRSRSGGAFWELSKVILQNGGFVYGASLESDLKVKYIKVDNIENNKKLQGSKYVECDNTGLLQSIKEDLINNKMVLFAGTPCQVAGLKSYINKSRIQNSESLLITVDIICHGVQSSDIYRDYIKFIEKKYRGKIEKFDFRDKSMGWSEHVESFDIRGKRVFRNNYTSLFYQNLGLRPSCGNCQFASYNRPGDITIADFWGKQPEEFKDNKGISNLIINSEKGETLFSEIKNNILIVELSKKDCYQPNLEKPSKVPTGRDEFWKIYKENGIQSLLIKYGRYDLVRRFLWKFRDLPRLKRNGL